MPLGNPISFIKSMIASGKVRAASIVDMPSVFTPRSSAAYACFSGQMGAVNLKPNEEINNMIVELACFVAYGRCPVDRDPYSRNVLTMPQPEGTPRLIKQFMQLGTGLTLIHEKTGFDLEIFEILKKVGRDLLPAVRLKILRYLSDENVFEYLKERRKTKDIADSVNIPTPTAKLCLEDMMLVGLLNRDVDGDQEKSPYTWQITDVAQSLIANSEVFEITQNVPF